MAAQKGRRAIDRREVLGGAGAAVLASIAAGSTAQAETTAKLPAPKGAKLLASEDSYDGYDYFSLRPITVVDDIRLAPGKRQAFIERLTGVYVPEVERRGYVLKNSWIFPPMDVPGQESDLMLRWELANTAALYKAPRDSHMGNSFIEDFWTGSSEMIVHRSRRLGRSANELFTRPKPAPAARPKSADKVVERHILLLKPVDQGATPSAAFLEEANKKLARGGHVAECRLKALHAFSARSDRLVWDIDLHPGAPGMAATAAVPAGYTIEEHVRLGDIIGMGARKPDMRNGWKRYLFYKASKLRDQAHQAAFEETLIEFPKHIVQLCNWRVSRVAESFGGRGFTHILEHEMERVEDVLGPYNAHPYHWAIHDRFVQPDAPEYAVPEIWHGFYSIEKSALA